ncbi:MULTISPECIES: DUF4192 domain-containing protein [unclassified Streptomyces]|uniref:DUF4192 domain-containing protein n=1 Tax=unclassified Streptomyces TaxID=2593676 RepID=UPI002258F970|nr:MULTISPECIES: DUF4192 domain-containing protein [unclassified Streptomyces]MCX5051517.1 DUF4192 domain-containing protein [Streptomyces sp. NBC_00474]MCX5249409.1 DUF4192 domain-containing protein [Streptomyces sp. NBC_00201]
MTNHGETTGSPDNGKAGGREDRESNDGHHESHGRREMPAGPTSPDGHGGRYDPGKRGGQDGYAERPGRRPDHADCTAYDSHGAEHQVTLRTPAELADALPYLLGYRPEDSIVLVALHDRDSRGRFGGRARLGIPTSADDWASVAEQLAHGLVTGSERRGARPEQMVAYLCQEPAKGETGRQVMERLRPLAQKLRVECGQLDVPVIEALCISEGRFWSYCCVNEACCPPAGLPMGLPGTSVLAAAATYAGLQVRGTLRELRVRLLPWETAAALEQEGALDAASMALVPRILDDASRAGVAEETLELAALVMRRLADAPPVSGALTADLRDDELLAHDEVATLILGLQDRATRDRAAEWMEGETATAALRLWRALARRCVGSYGEHAAAPLTLAGWVAWSTGDELEAREALAMALGADPSYLFARLLHQACNEGLDPESIRRCLRAERKDRARTTAQQVHGEEEIAGPVAGGAVEPVPVPKGASRARRRARPGSTVGNQPRSAKAGGRGSGAGVPRPRTRVVGGTRPGSARTDRSRPSVSGKDAARCRNDGLGSFQPGGDSVEGEA